MRSCSDTSILNPKTHKGEAGVEGVCVLVVEVSYKKRGKTNTQKKIKTKIHDIVAMVTESVKQ